jgi:hypothetical protein
MPKSIEELQLMARTELMRNRSITTYTFKDGVEKRRPANPRARLALVAESALAFIGRLGILDDPPGSKQMIGNEYIPYGATFGSVITRGDRHIRLRDYLLDHDAWTYEEVGDA